MTKWTRILIVASVVSLAPAFALAQTNAAANAAANKKKKEANVLRAIRGKVKNVSNDKKRTTAGKFVSDIRRWETTVSAKVSSAKGVRKSCLQSAHGKITGYLTAAQNAESAMKTALLDGDAKKANRAYARVVFAYGQAKKEQEAATRCVGSGATYSGETTVEVKIDSDVRVVIAFTPDGTPRIPAVASLN